MLNGKCIDLLGQAGITLDPEALKAMQRHVRLIREWNAFASLVSKGDLERLGEWHVSDSLSLAPVVLRACGPSGRLMDIGSGGGFPAIPLKIVLPDLELTLVERSVRRVGFLRKVLGALGLSKVKVVHGEFPVCVRGQRADAITARAVDKSRDVLKGVLEFMDEGAVFLCQSVDPRGLLADAFHVERIQDDWTAHGLRRGDLFLVRRATE